MYGQALGGAGVASTGAILLPNTGGNVLLTALSIAFMTIGGVVLLSTVARAVAKHSFRAN